VALNKDRKTELISSYRTHESDTGSPEVQVAILSETHRYLTEHFQNPREGSPLATRPASSSSGSAAACSTTSRARIPSVL